MHSILSRATRRASTKLRNFAYSPRRWLARQTRPITTVRLGTKYGGWHFVQPSQLHTAILCGAGEDISFDLSIQSHFGCKIVIVDPTPRSTKHFEYVMNALKNGTPAKINNRPDQLYSLSNVDPSRIQFIPAAIWKEKTEVKFYEPFNNSHVSHSITNFQKTLSFIKVPAETLSGICARAGIQPENIDILKLDIEGAEYDVIQWITQSNIRPKQILVEFDELNFANRHTAERVKASVGMLNSIGYRMAHFDGLSNCTFVRDTLISD